MNVAPGPHWALPTSDLVALAEDRLSNNTLSLRSQGACRRVLCLAKLRCWRHGEAWGAPMLMLETMIRRPVGLLTAAILIAASGCWKDTVIGVSDKPERPASPPRDEPRPSAPKVATMFAATLEEGVGDNNPILGDVDGDGLDDFVILTVGGGLGAAMNKAYLFYGRSDFPARLSTGDADAMFIATSNGAVPLGDINGDGLADFALGQSRGFEIVLGDRTRYHGDYPEYSGAIVWEPNELPDLFADDVATVSMDLRAAGDVNADGLDDLLIGAATVAPEGEEATATGGFGLRQTHYLVLGHAGPWPSGRWDPSMADAEFGTVSIAGSSQPLSAIIPYRAGDLDADGNADLIAPVEGALLVFYGGDALVGKLGAERVDAELVARHPNPATALGDLDGDGASDLIMSDYEAQLQVIYGSRTRWSGRTTVEPELTIQAEPSYQGELAAAVGDIDGNGAAELVIGLPSFGGDFSREDVVLPTGAVYVLRGDGESRRRGEYRLTDRDVMVLSGPQLNPSDRSGLGNSLSIAGDVDGDGNADILAGAPYAMTSEGAFGAVYLIPSTPKAPD